MDFLAAYCTAWTHPVSGQSGQPLQTPQQIFSPLGWNQSLTFAPQSLREMIRFCSMVCAEENCKRGGGNRQRDKVRSQIIPSEFPVSLFCPLPFPQGAAQRVAQPGQGSPRSAGSARLQSQRQGVHRGGGRGQELGESAETGLVLEGSRPERYKMTTPLESGFAISDRTGIRIENGGEEKKKSCY